MSSLVYSTLSGGDAGPSSAGAPVTPAKRVKTTTRTPGSVSRTGAAAAAAGTPSRVGLLAAVASPLRAGGSLGDRDIRLQRENDELRRHVLELRKEVEVERLKVRQAHREKVQEVKQVRMLLRTSEE